MAEAASRFILAGLGLATIRNSRSRGPAGDVETRGEVVMPSGRILGVREGPPVARIGAISCTGRPLLARDIHKPAPILDRYGTKEVR